MIQAAKFYFKAKAADLDSDAINKIYGGLVAAVLLLTMYFWYNHLDAKHHRRIPLATTQTAPAIPAPAPQPVAAPYTPPPVTSQPEVAVVAPAAETSSNSNSLSAKTTTGSLGDSLMSVLSPSAKAETVQPAFQSMKAADGSAMPAARMPLRMLAPPRPQAPLTDDQKRLKAAQDKVDKLIDMAAKNPDTFGFAPDDKFDQMQLGDPIPVYTVMASDRDSYQDGQPIKSLLQPTREWLFPVMLDDQIRVMVPVRRIGKEYVAGTCSRALAMVYEKIQDRWPAAQGFHPQLVVNPNMTGYYFTVPELPTPNLTDTSAMFEYNPNLSPASVILASWR
jgi:hypothetical protein